VDLFFNDFDTLLQQSEELLLNAPLEKPVRLLGISISKLDNDMEENQIGIQLKLDFPHYSNLP
jgi:hypothetical protein